MSKFSLKTHEVIKECGTWNFSICVMDLSMFIVTEQCFDFLFFHLLTTDLDQRRIKEYSVSHSVEEQRVILAKKGSFLKKKGHQRFPHVLLNPFFKYFT